MVILLLSFLGGVLTIFSPCVLPVVPFVFSRSDQPFHKAGLPMLIGMALSFAGFAALSVTGGNWVIQANQFGRIFALAVFTVLGLTLLLPRFADQLMQPLVRLGGALQKKADSAEKKGSGISSSLLLGASIGLLWAPCAGPILGLVLAGAALGGSNERTLGLLLVFAAGAATSLGVAIFAGGKVLRSLKKGLGAEEWIKRALGIVVLVAVAGIALGLDTRILAKISYFNTAKIEQGLVEKVTPAGMRLASTQASSEKLSDEGALPSLEGATDWLNSKPLTNAALKGKVVLVDFWTYSCINCLRTLPYLKLWNEKYRDQGLVMIGVHAPEFAFEKNIENVKKAVADLGVTYPVAVDNQKIIWNAFQNQYWPAHYFVDMNGRIRHHHFGEGSYEESEKVIQELLMELHPNGMPALKVMTTKVVAPTSADGVEAVSNYAIVKSPETYLGSNRQKGQVKNRPVSNLKLNEWEIIGPWQTGTESIRLDLNRVGSKPASIVYRFHARDVHLVLGSVNGKPIRFRVTMDGKAPGNSHGTDIDAEGNGVVNSQRLYQLIRQRQGGWRQDWTDHTFQIEFLDSGVEAFAFTFG